MGKKAKRRQRAVDGAGSPAGTMKFTAPTLGLEDVFFVWGTSKDAARFEDTVSKLARHVDTSPWPQSSVASKAMSTLKSPEFEEPAIPTREYWANTERTAKTRDRSRTDSKGEIVDNPPVTEDWEHNLQVEEYKSKRKVYNDQMLAWKENKAKCYYFVLSHSLRALEYQLKNSSKWEETEGNQYVAVLLKRTRKITQNKKERKKSVMTTMESDVELYTLHQSSWESLQLDFPSITKWDVVGASS